MKKRLFFYGTVIPLVVMNLFTYSEYKDQEKTIADTYSICNRQIDVINMSHRERVEELENSK